jgi:hypothetical protein
MPVDESLEPLDDLSLDTDYWLTVADPEDVACALIKDNSDLYEFYELTLGYPIEDEMRVARKILQLKACLAKSSDSTHAPVVFKIMFDAESEWDDPEKTLVPDDPMLALTQLAELLRRVKERYPKAPKVMAEQATDDAQDVDDDYRWASVFEDIEKVRKLLANNHVKAVPPKPRGLTGRVSYWLTRHMNDHETEWAETRKIIRNLSGTRKYDGDDCEHIVERLRGRVQQIFAESRGVWKDVCRFHTCLEDAVR